MSKIIAVDFDGTICHDCWPDMGQPNMELINYLKEQQKQGSKIILWTCRQGGVLNNAVNYCLRYGLEFDAVNDNIPENIKKYDTNSRKISADEYIDDKSYSPFNLPYAEHLISNLEEPKSQIQKWAEKEVELASVFKKNKESEEDSKYERTCYESALKAFNSLMGQGHTMYSIGLTNSILSRLIESKPLTPIEDTDDVWDNLFHSGEGKYEFNRYQCTRMSSLFKDVYTDGRVTYSDVDSFYCVDVKNQDHLYHSGIVQRMVDELFPIHMPYYPEAPIKVYCEDFLYDDNNGDFDTMGIFNIIKSDGTDYTINKFYKEFDNTWIEINHSEYMDRFSTSIQKGC